MKYTVYQITNKINGKIYIGKHQTKDLNDGYMGSGKMLKRAQQKYGIENFVKEILHVYDTEEEMNAKEAALVTEEFCLREDTYNICVGGQGGFSYINTNRLNGFYQPDVAQKARYSVNNILEDRYGSDWRKIISLNGHKALQRILEEDPNYLKDRASRSFSGKQHTDKTKQLMSEKAKARLSDPTRNSQFGTMWITNGTINKKIKTVDFIPEGWYKGRKTKVSHQPP
jgi:hypothetical protein